MRFISRLENSESPDLLCYVEDNLHTRGPSRGSGRNFPFAKEVVKTVGWIFSGIVRPWGVLDATINSQVAHRGHFRI
jgi:hypothetical protein